MCGISGIFAYHYAANSVNRKELLATRDHMIARGPDGAGLWLSDEERVGFGHRRLAIIDLSELGAQPMRTVDGRFTITFNGEIYNYQTLRRDLEGKGYVFRSQSDTEVLLHLYADRGADMVHALRGMYAFAIWDNVRRELFLARDPYGIKPLYYSDDGWTFRFASQVKALLAGGAVSREPDPAGEVGFFLFGHIPEPFTTHRAISALPAGCTLVVDRIGPRAPHRYHSIAALYCDAESIAPDERGGVDFEAEFRAAALDSVRHHLIADVPIGVFLSAGIDSSSLVALMRDCGQQQIDAVTISFDDFVGTQDDEAPLAALVAQKYGVRHTIRRVDKVEFNQELPRIFEAMDLPSIDAINTWFAAKAAREIGLKVAISGLGGDELLGGYPSFRVLPRWTRMMSIPSKIPFLGCVARRFINFSKSRQVSPKAAGIIEYGGDYAGAYLLKRGLFMPWELPKVLNLETIHAGLTRLDPLGLVARTITPMPINAFSRVSTLESSLYMRNQLLRDADWAAMAHSIEVRVPLVDVNLLTKTAEIAAKFREKPSKTLLVKASANPIPSAISARNKTGFVTPIAVWQSQISSRNAQGRSYSSLQDEPWARNWSKIVYHSTMTPCSAA